MVIPWSEHVKNYFLEEGTKEYLIKHPKSESVEKAIKVYYNFNNKNEDTGNYIVLYRHDSSSFHPRLNPQLRGSAAGKTNKWLEEQYKLGSPIEIPAPFNLKEKINLGTTTRFSLYDKYKGWFVRYYVPNILAVMVEKDFGHEIVGNRKSSKIFTFDLD